MRKEKLEELKRYAELFKTIQVQEKYKVLEGTEKEQGFLNITEKICQLKNGETIKRETILKNGKEGNASCILPFTKKGTVILVVEPRVSTNHGVALECPAGYIDEGENAKDAAERELREETGYLALPENIKEVASYYQDQGISNAYNHAFVAFDCTKAYDQSLDEGEYVKVFECTYEEVLELVKNGYINDANSLLAIKSSSKEAKQYVFKRNIINFLTFRK